MEWRFQVLWKHKAGHRAGDAEGEVGVVFALHIGARWYFTRRVILESRSKEGE